MAYKKVFYKIFSKSNSLDARINYLNGEKKKFRNLNFYIILKIWFLESDGYNFIFECTCR